MAVMRKSLAIWGTVLVLVLAWIAYLMVVLPDQVAYELPAPNLKTLDPAKTDLSWKVMNMDGKMVNLSEYIGKPIMLNIWATWCAPCVSEMPAFMKLAADPKMKDFHFLFVAIESNETFDQVNRFVAERNFKLPAFYSREDDMPAMFKVPQIPATFLINADGVVLGVETQSAKWDLPDVPDKLIRFANAKPPRINEEGSEASNPGG